MELRVGGRLLYSSSFDEKTGNVLRVVEELNDGHSRLAYEIQEKVRQKFPHRWRVIPSPSPELCDISITDRCGFGCDFCYQDSRPQRNHGHKDLVETILKGFDTVPYQIAIGGGEPTTHPDFPYILRKARELGTVPNYTTNGAKLTPEVVEATNEVCGGVAMTYHSFKGLDWFKKHYLTLKTKLNVKLNVHLIADKNVAKNLRDLADTQDELGRLSVVLLAYYPDVGRASMDLLMTRTVYSKKLPEAVVYARNKAVDISFSEGLLPYFNSRPELGINTQFAMKSEGVFSCYFDPQGRISASSFDTSREGAQKSIYTDSPQSLWENLWSPGGEPWGEACYSCPHRSRCSVPHDFHYFICAFAPHNSLPLETPEEPIQRRTRFEILTED